MSTEKNEPTQNIGRLFIWIAWLLALALLVFVFQGLLEDQWNPNSSPEYSLNNSGKAEVQLMQNRHGHYVTKGYINEQAVVFLLDTGATNVSIPVHIAENLGLESYGSILHKQQTVMLGCLKPN